MGLFCMTALQKRLYSANETYNSREHTNRSHLIVDPKPWTLNLNPEPQHLLSKPYTLRTMRQVHDDEK